MQCVDCNTNATCDWKRLQLSVKHIHAKRKTQARARNGSCMFISRVKRIHFHHSKHIPKSTARSIVTPMASSAPHPVRPFPPGTLQTNDRINPQCRCIAPRWASTPAAPSSDTFYGRRKLRGTRGDSQGRGDRQGRGDSKGRERGRNG